MIASVVNLGRSSSGKTAAARVLDTEVMDSSQDKRALRCKRTMRGGNGLSWLTVVASGADSDSEAEWERLWPLVRGGVILLTVPSTCIDNVSDGKLSIQTRDQQMIHATERLERENG